MRLLQLPTEILVEIFHHVGSSYFRADLSRLTVCKQWSELALPTFFREFYVAQETLRRLMSSQHVELNTPLIRSSLETLSLRLRGFEDWDPSSLSTHDPGVAGASRVLTINGVPELEVRTAWTKELNDDLVRLATIVRQFRKFHTLIILARSELNPAHLLMPRRDYLCLTTIRAFLSATSLTVLDLDLCGSQLEPLQSRAAGETLHICPNIAALLPTLRRLRLRLRTICPEVLRLQQQSTNISLSHVLVNLSMSNESPLTTAAMHSFQCGSPFIGYIGYTEFLQLKADLEEQAQVLATQMVAPRIVRILTHKLPHVEMRAFDALIGKNLMLGKDAEWDDEGKIVEEQVSDDESEISDFSSDSDT